jgi:hypothetical protein
MTHRRGGAAVALVLITAIVVLETRLTRMGGLGGGRYRLLAGLLAWWVLLGAAALVLRAVPRRAAIAMILIGAVALPAAAMTTSVQISDDVFRYAWDGRVQAAAVDPYRYPPVAPELQRFRDPWLWPDDATCARIGRVERPCTRINRLDVRTIYPPVAEAWFAVMHALPGPDRDAHQRLYACLLSVALALLLLVVLPRLGRDPRLAVLYAWSPVAGFDIASDAHVDVVAGLLVTGAVALAAVPRRVPPGDRGGDPDRRRPLGAMVLAGAAVAVKIYPLLLLPALVPRVHDRRSLTRALGLGLVAVGVVLLTYLPHVLAVGPDVLGYLPGYLQEEQYGGKATRFLVLGLLHLPALATQVLAGVVLLSAAGWALCSRASVPLRAVGLVGAAFLVATPVQPWYAVVLVVLAVLSARPEWLLVAAAAYPAYFAAVLRDPRFVGIGQLSYGLAALGVAVTALARMPIRLPSRFMTGVTHMQPDGLPITKA